MIINSPVSKPTQTTTGIELRSVSDGKRPGWSNRAVTGLLGGAGESLEQVEKHADALMAKCPGRSGYNSVGLVNDQLNALLIVDSSTVRQHKEFVQIMIEYFGEERAREIGVQFIDENSDCTAVWP